MTITTGRWRGMRTALMLRSFGRITDEASPCVRIRHLNATIFRGRNEAVPSGHGNHTSNGTAIPLPRPLQGPLTGIRHTEHSVIGSCNHECAVGHVGYTRHSRGGGTPNRFASAGLPRPYGSAATPQPAHPGHA